MVESSIEAGLKELEQRCRESGTPLTVQRRAILAALVARSDHPTADDICGDIAKTLPGVSRGTVYRSLDAMVARGLIRRVCHPGSACRYDAKTERHHHLVCDRCGSMADLEDPVLDRLRMPDTSNTGFAVRDYSVQFHGFCAACAEAERADLSPKS